MYCQHCNVKLKDEIEVCPYCREKTGYEKPKASNLAGTINIWFWLLCFFVPVVGIVFYIIYRKKTKLPFLSEEQFYNVLNSEKPEDAAVKSFTESVFGIANFNDLTYEEYVEHFDKTHKANNDKMLSFREAFAYGLILELIIVAIIFIVYMTILGCNPNAKHI